MQLWIVAICYIQLQQCLPLAVLKLVAWNYVWLAFSGLQQCLPLAVLKLDCGYGYVEREIVATVLTACGIETNVLKNIM